MADKNENLSHDQAQEDALASIMQKKEDILHKLENIQKNKQKLANSINFTPTQAEAEFNKLSQERKDKLHDVFNKFLDMHGLPKTPDEMRKRLGIRESATSRALKRSKKLSATKTSITKDKKTPDLKKNLKRSKKLV